jgi:hypothetical protein
MHSHTWNLAANVAMLYNTPAAYLPRDISLTFDMVLYQLQQNLNRRRIPRR